ncbi:MAG: hypothetical protein ACI8PZ_002980 [Myxococcota bacterium]|jgi:hypothetical protein
MTRTFGAVVLSLLLLGCVDDAPSGKQRTESDPDPCSARDNPELDLAQDADYGLSDGDLVRYGHPPQGGPPYAPFRLKIDGIYGGEHGVEVTIEAFDDATGAPIGDLALTHRFLCANTGPDAGHLVAGEVHLRFWDETLESLVGRTATIVATVDAMDGSQATAAYTGALDWAWD